MNISVLALKLIILLFPGLIAALIYRRLTVKHKERSDFMFVLIAIVEGITSYLTVQVAYLCLIFINNLFVKYPLDYKELNTFKNLTNTHSIAYSEVLLASVVAVLIGLITVKLSQNNTLNKLALKFNISNKYGDENLYSNFLNDNCLTWVNVQDMLTELVYRGAVEAFSESADFKEIVLNNVTVYQYIKGKPYKELYDIPKIYLCLPKDKVIIEKIEEEDEETNNSTDQTS